MKNPIEFSWGHNQQVTVQGTTRSGLNDWPGWVNGDSATLTYDPRNSSLTLTLDRTLVLQNVFCIWY